MRSNARRSAMAVLATTGLALSIGSVAQAGVQPVPTPRIANAGGIAMVPTPDGLEIPGLTEDVMANCFIGGGCAARQWTAYYDQDGTGGVDDTQARFFSNVGIAPTVRLARRDLIQTSQSFQDIVTPGGSCPTGHNCWGWSGSSNTWTGAKGRVFTALTANDGTTPNPGQYRIALQARQGKRMVYLSYILGDYAGTLTSQPPSAMTVAALAKKANRALNKKSGWSQVPQTVLP